MDFTAESKASSGLPTVCGLRRGKREERDAHLKRRSVRFGKGVKPFHRAMRGRKRAARYVIMALARLERRLFAHNALTIDMVHHAARIGNPPMPRQQLDLFVRSVLDADVINPEPLARFRVRLFREEVHRDPHGDALSDGGVLEEFFHRFSR